MLESRGESIMSLTGAKFTGDDLSQLGPVHLHKPASLYPVVSMPAAIPVTVSRNRSSLAALKRGWLSTST